MLEGTELAGSFTLPGTSTTVNRMGYAAMQLAGRDGDKPVWGSPADVEKAIAVLREALASGVNHIDTADFYGPVLLIPGHLLASITRISRPHSCRFPLK